MKSPRNDHIIIEIDDDLIEIEQMRVKQSLMKKHKVIKALILALLAFTAGFALISTTDIFKSAQTANRELQMYKGPGQDAEVADAAVASRLRTGRWELDDDGESLWVFDEVSGEDKKMKTASSSTQPPRPPSPQAMARWQRRLEEEREAEMERQINIPRLVLQGLNLSRYQFEQLYIGPQTWQEMLSQIEAGNDDAAIANILIERTIDFINNRMMKFWYGPVAQDCYNKGEKYTTKEEDKKRWDEIKLRYPYVYQNELSADGEWNIGVNIVKRPIITLTSPSSPQTAKKEESRTEADEASRKKADEVMIQQEESRRALRKI